MVRSRHGVDEILAAALAAGQTVKSAAETAGIGIQTAWRRLRNPAFKARVAELRQDMISAAVGKLVDGMSESANVLRALLGAESEATRLGAAKAGLELPVRLHESTELEERVAALERAAKGVKCPPPPPTDEEQKGDDDGTPA